MAAVFMGLDYFSVRGTPTERVLVVSVRPSKTLEICGPRSFSPDTAGERSTYRSTNPPVGLPAEFSVNHCPDWDETPGEVVTVRRTGVGQDDIYFDPIESAWQWLGMAGGAGAVAAVIVVPATWTKEAWAVHRAQSKRLRHLAQDQDA